MVAPTPGYVPAYRELLKSTPEFVHAHYTEVTEIPLFGYTLSYYLLNDKNHSEKNS